MTSFMYVYIERNWICWICQLEESLRFAADISTRRQTVFSIVLNIDVFFLAQAEYESTKCILTAYGAPVYEVW